ncbi:MAG: small ribosomal subunit biogenesis GTPase RsgA [Candidatus Thiodiazotropha sp. (ex Ctena orbiculata)]|nr:small ribosomal subunit biogenesis GTPase RsgA [Candidatus Thiodiazotropha taylori]MBT2996695.1 small ribosomal subunit biogenesis GTPase RsgA [Candidatus Thiodiazotropha taylori]MBT3001433.1 small ribosomal subunit biogenesis GTPase RsgA [Candidatus Thiodiazotropha taylori]MBT3027236.1 small ribosomal subunit biogenesis GTPase RsgA [Candidatus Thiodiazotropha taylori]MBT3034870.1 small ribosomal subunit biogenesis GTPase RsgA [Candidatus Thiodiazotropha taylori]
MARRRLSKQQKNRIQAIQEKRRGRLDSKARQSLSAAGESPPQEGRVIIRHGATLGIMDAQGKLYRCQTRQNIGHPVCGDWVIWQQVDETTGVVTALLPRNSVLSRPDYSGRQKPLAANITQLVIVLAPRPEPSGYLLDQYLVTAETIAIPPLIAINKLDLLEGGLEHEFLQRFDPYRSIGYPVIGVSAKREHGLDLLIDKLKDETSILLGQSGVGKSSLVNALLPTMSVETGRLSDATGLGRHTTSAATCYSLPQGGELIDSPGVRSFRLTDLSQQELEQGFTEFHPFLGRCRFHNCSHDHEPGCAIQAAMESGEINPLRLENFLRLSQAVGR